MERGTMVSRSCSAGSSDERRRSRELNDRFRTTMTGGRVMMDRRGRRPAPGREGDGDRRVATFTEFTPENDPHSEH